MVPIPINDNVRRSTFWIITLLLIAANVWVFAYLELGVLNPNHELNEFIKIYGIVPARYIRPDVAVQLSREERYLLGHYGHFGALMVPIFASMFLHGGWLHLLGNMLFLFVFGRSVEDRFGHIKFLVIYFLGGVGGAALHIVVSSLIGSGSQIPSIGASGAIAAILGAYFVSFPRARISTIVWLIFFLWRMELPAVLILGYWFLIQFVSGYTQSLSIQSATAGGVAFWAHVGGFICGLLLALILGPRRAEVEIVE